MRRVNMPRKLKAHLFYGYGKWWCYRMGCTGVGSTPAEAWQDMWDIYRQAYRPAVEQPLYSPRSG